MGGGGGRYRIQDGEKREQGAGFPMSQDAVEIEKEKLPSLLFTTHLRNLFATFCNILQME